MDTIKSEIGVNGFLTNIAVSDAVHIVHVVKCMADRKSTMIEEVRREAGAHAKRAIRVLVNVMNNDRTPPATRATAAMKLLELAYGRALESDAGTSVSDLLENLGHDAPPNGEGPKNNGR